MSSALAGPKKDGRAYAVMVRSGVLLLAHASPDGVGGPYTGRGQYTTPDTREKAPGVWRLRTLDRRERPAPLCQGSADACSSWVRAALPPSSAACVPCRRVSGSVEPHQEKMGMHTTLLIHFAQDRLARLTCSARIPPALVMCFVVIFVGCSSVTSARAPVRCDAPVCGRAMWEGAHARRRDATCTDTPPWSILPAVDTTACQRSPSVLVEAAPVSRAQARRPRSVCVRQKRANQRGAVAHALRVPSAASRCRRHRETSSRALCRRASPATMVSGDRPPWSGTGLCKTAARRRRRCAVGVPPPW